MEQMLVGLGSDLITIAVKLVMAGVAIWCAIQFSAWLDRRARIKFADSMAVIRKSAQATADYHRGRLLVLAIIVAACFF